jgi:hypothetical protein
MSHYWFAKAHEGCVGAMRRQQTRGLRVTGPAITANDAATWTPALTVTIPGGRTAEVLHRNHRPVERASHAHNHDVI